MYLTLVCLVGFADAGEAAGPVGSSPTPKSSLGAVPAGHESHRSTSRGPTDHPLFAGIDEVLLSSYLIDPDTGEAVPAFKGTAAWGAAWDPAAGVLYHSAGSTLFAWNPGGANTLLGDVVSAGGSPLPLYGLAFHDGTLFAISVLLPAGPRTDPAHRSGVTDIVYTIDPATLQATPFIAGIDPASISGLAADPTTGELYGTDDVSSNALVRINPNGTLTVIAPYLGGENDVDGLAIGPDRRAYLITDDPSPPEFNVYDLEAGVWVDPVPYPWGSSNGGQVSGAWIELGSFDTLGFSWNSEHGRYYTVFNRASALPVSGPDPAGGNFIGAGEFLDGVCYMLDVANTLYAVDAATGQLLGTTATTAPPTTEEWTGMAIDPTTGTMYASSANLSTSSLFTLDVATGVAGLIGTVTNSPGLIAIAIDGAGELWGYDIITDELLSIDKATAAGNPVGPLGFDAEFGQGLGWDERTDTLWAAAFNNTTNRGELRKVDRATGSTGFFGVLGDGFPGGLNQLPWLGIATADYVAIFSDGFESGDTSAWGNTVP